MKKFITFILMALLIFSLCSCDPYAKDMEAMQQRIAELERQQA